MSESLHIVCPHCDATNRVPLARVAERPGCGKCHAPLFLGQPLELSASRFDRHIGGDLPVLVDFWAPWCGPCLSMAPEFAKAAVRLEPKVRLAKVDTEAHQALASRFAIRSIPTLILFRGGREIARQAGAMGALAIADWVGRHS